MFWLGHMCWAYIGARAGSSLLNVKMNPYIVMFLGIIPDADLLFDSLGLVHRTILHSMILWTLLFIPFFIKYRKVAIPYFIAVSQHILFGDLLVGRTNIIWPLNLKVGLSLPLVSLENIVIEGIGFAIFVTWFILNGDRHTLFGIKRSNTLSILPLAPLLAFTLFLFMYNADIGFDSITSVNVRKLLDNSLIPIVFILHLLLASILSISMLQGTRAILKITHNT